MIDEKLLEFATERQREVLEAVNKYGSARAASKALGLTPNGSTVLKMLNAVKLRAALRGYSPDHDMNRIVPDGFLVKGTSTYYNKEGKPVGQWVKSQVDLQRQRELLMQAAEAASAVIPRMAALPAPTTKLGADLATLYSLYDFHWGMHSWAKETGADWDLRIAARIFDGAFGQFFARTPEADLGIVNLGGDCWHYDSMQPLTNRSGNILDADSRKMKMLQMSVVAIRRAVDLALLKHKRVILIIQEGNHDEETAVNMQVMFEALYEKEPRVTVLVSPLPYYVVEHGAAMLAFHHGHLKKINELPLLFAAMFREAWGRAKMTYIHTGHYHHAYEKEHSGAIVTQHPTLAAPDSYSARSGYVSNRAALAHTYHKDGSIECVTHVSPKMMEEAGASH